MITNKHVYAVFLIYVYHRTKPNMGFHQEYNKGPLHSGLFDMQLRAYAWTKKEVDNYIKMKEQEDMHLLETVDGSVKAAMEALGDELEKYLREAGEEIELPKEKKFNPRKPPTIYDPFIAPIRGVFNVFASTDKKGNKRVPGVLIAKERALAARDAKGTLWQVYKNFKKKNRCLNW